MQTSKHELCDSWGLSTDCPLQPFGLCQLLKWTVVVVLHFCVMGDKVFCFLNVSEVNKQAVLSSIYQSNTWFSIFGSLNATIQIDLHVVGEAFSCVSRTACFGISFFQIMKSVVACLFLKTVVLQTRLGVILFSSLHRGYTDPLEDLDQNPCVPSRYCFMSLTSHLRFYLDLFLPLAPSEPLTPSLQEANNAVMKNVTCWKRGNFMCPLFLCKRLD